MHAKFQVAGFQTKRDMIYVDFVCLFTGPGDWWFLVRKSSDFHIKYMLPTFSYFTKVLCIRGMWVTQTPDFTRHYLLR